MKKLHKDYWGQITVLFSFGLSLSRLTETLKMVFINQLDLNWFLTIFTIFLLRDKNLKLNCWVEMKQDLSYMRSTFIVMEPTLHCDHQTKNLPCYHEQALCAGLWETVRLWRAHVCGREWVCGHKWVCAGLRLSSGVLLHHFPRDPTDRQGLSVNEAAVLV